MFCNFCGEPLEEGVKYCPGCGRPVKLMHTANRMSTQSAPGITQETPKKKTPIIILTVILAVLLVAAAIVGVIFINSENGRGNNHFVTSSKIDDDDEEKEEEEDKQENKSDDKESKETEESETKEQDEEEKSKEIESPVAEADKESVSSENKAKEQDEKQEENPFASEEKEKSGQQNEDNKSADEEENPFAQNVGQDLSELSEEELFQYFDSDEDIFIFPNSDTVALTEEDMAFAKGDKRILALARNEIFARKGYRFTVDPTAIDYFNKKKWYQDLTKVDQYDYNDLSDIEKNNVDIIQRYEDEAAIGNQ